MLDYSSPGINVRIEQFAHMGMIFDYICAKPRNPWARLRRALIGRNPKITALFTIRGTISHDNLAE